ncbi:MAG TPA: glutamine-hydrolyzing carbamoyl-phosphate synthase small subunit [Acidimicrobiales bacterium]|nr:glutamine-hydrolyzing carbamoyl-phosphate synthase small subunit [Acidimicrobiales bacterium]
MKEALLVLSDGAVFEGEAIGAAVPNGVATGELVFNTVMSGYQEVITDPSYAGQVIAFTYPHIGNYGVAPDDDESRRPWCRGVVLRDLASRPSSWRCAEGLDRFLERHGVPGIAGVDTRRLTRHIREAGALPCAFGPAEEAALLAAARAEAGTEGIDLATAVSTPERYRTGDGPFRIVAYDFGIKRAMLRRLGAMARVDVVPSTTSAEEVLADRPDGVLLSNGPGDPAPLAYAVDTIRGLLGNVPVFGICLGHQLLATALGGVTYKLTFGHHGGNHPVRRMTSDSVEITSQNHNYAVADGSVPDADVTHVNLNDGVIEGLRSRSVAAFGVQYHPEAGPGPHDAAYLFQEFRLLMEANA